ncbi:hypothetical protein M6G08_35700 (plasmid) [Streptomyces sp. M92]|nr:hypothetical protein M6G08_35700 [Streptomyces sp. M92]
MCEFLGAAAESVAVAERELAPVGAQFVLGLGETAAVGHLDGVELRGGGSRRP